LDNVRFKPMGTTTAIAQYLPGPAEGWWRAMSEALTPQGPALGRPALGGAAALAAADRRPLDSRRALQLVLAFIWLLDGVLQYQSFMFTKAFSQTLAATAAGNPGVIAHPITWVAGIVGDHPTATNAAFATVQLLLGLGIAWRPTRKPALACSVAWAVAVWWFGEGLGGVLDGGANPLSGAPGAVILYALLAVLLWPTRESDPAPQTGIRPGFVAERPVGPVAARILWVVLWGSLAYFAVVPSVGADGLHDMIAGMEGTNPAWLNALLRGGASAVAGHGEGVSVLLAVLLGLIALGVFLPPVPRRATVLLAVLLSLMIWVFGEALGALFGGQGTDVNSGPLLILIAAAYWPKPAGVPVVAKPVEEGASR